MAARAVAAEPVAMRLPSFGAGVVALGCAMALAGCRAPDTPISDAAMLADFEPPLAIGRTTRADALLRLGAPAERFEGDRILCWRIARTGSGRRPASVYVSPWYGSDLAAALSRSNVDPRVRIEASSVTSLVLVFDAGGVLQRARALRQP